MRKNGRKANDNYIGVIADNVKLSQEGTIIVFTDASFDPETMAYGWAAWIQYGQHRDILKVCKQGYYPRRVPGSTHAEIHALVQAVSHLGNAGIPLKGKTIILHSDCLHALLSRTIQNDLKTYLLHKEGVSRVKVKHVRGHRGHHCPHSSVNTWCHNRAYRGMRKQRRKIQKRMGISS